MCLAIPSIIVSDFYAKRSTFIVNMWFKSFSLPLQVFRPYFLVFLALSMFYFCEIPCKHLQNKNFPPSCCFHFANHGLLRIDHGWQNENKMAENFCFASVCTEFRKNKTCQEPKRLENRV